MESLAEVQRRLWQLISAPDGVAAALAAEEGDGASDLAAWIAADPKRDAVGRLEIYANAYFHRIHDVLADDYDTLAACAGAAGFHDLVTAYLLAHPSRHPSLRHVGAALPAYLADASPAAPFRRRWPWAADLARLEWALGEAFDAADAAPLRRETLARVAPEAWSRLVFDFGASVSLLDATWPVHETLATWRADGTALPPAAPSPTPLLVWRSDETVRYRALAGGEATLLRAARDGARFGDLCGLAALSAGEDEAPAAVAAALGLWVDAGMLVATRAAGEHSGSPGG